MFENRRSAYGVCSFFNEHCYAASINLDYADWVERLAKSSHENNS